MMELMGVQEGGMPDFEQFMWSLESIKIYKYHRQTDKR